ncbi:SAM-dependent methyltransferase [Corynebacterium suranareeae]|uniref:SAM-dependent methyltransferase n=1 Tax=Corynebacterium suranareeae TaxID=2506452 RepID=A0A160PQL8_9CORY|nr:class I SAM-dependent methyltransferase [Corynebacterium suranareeae]BAU95785.1 SAM-dependent methyltransferase [Corynebacterium suranareeae]
MNEPAHPPIPPVSKRNAPLFSDIKHRVTSASAFTQGSSTYHDVRPGYPAEVVELTKGYGRVLDVGAGTGKLTSELAADQIFALDPSMDMLRVFRTALPAVPCWQATAEQTGMLDSAVDLITCAQTWHWVDVKAASAEFERILAPDGAVLLVWNNLDTSIAWVHRLSRIMHAGDVLKPGFTPEITAPWSIAKEIRTTWNQVLTPEDIIQLAHTRSYWLNASEKIKNRVDDNLRWYLYEHLGFQAEVAVELPYRCDAFLLSRSGTLAGRT